MEVMALRWHFIIFFGMTLTIILCDAINYVHLNENKMSDSQKIGVINLLLRGGDDPTNFLTHLYSCSFVLLRRYTNYEHHRLIKRDCKI